jgi:3-deoxy-8-phosphooctulonate synthase
VHQEETGRARSVDVIQIPAFLCQQTTLLIAAGKTGKPVNIKKGQFMAPGSMKHPVGKIERTGSERILITERGAQFGYHNLVADMTAIPVMKEIGYPVVFDAGHQVRRYGIPSTDPAGGAPREFIPVLLRSAVAAGANGVFLDHRVADALCDAASCIRSTASRTWSRIQDLAALIRAQVTPGSAPTAFAFGSLRGAGRFPAALAVLFGAPPQVLRAAAEVRRDG